MTINQARVKLGKIVSKVFTDGFEQTYNIIAPQIPKGTEEATHQKYSGAVDSYIFLAEDLLDDEHYGLDHLATIANPLVVYSVFLRYHLITLFFVSRDQDEKCDFPEQDSQFFDAIFIGFWRNVVSKVGQSI